MNLRRLAGRAAVAGVSTALAATALVGASTVAANAVDNTTVYACTFGGNPAGNFSLKVHTAVLPASAPAGASFPGGVLNLDADLTAAAAVLGAVPGVDGGKILDYAASIGTTSVASPLTFGAATVDGASATMHGTGTNAAFTLPKAGNYKIQLPASFTFTPTIGGNAVPGVTLPCTAAAPGAGNLGSIVLSKHPVQVAPKAVKSKKGYNLTVKVKADQSYITPTGKVTAKYGAKKVTGTLKKGQVVLALPKAAKGKKITVSYSGDGFTNAGAAQVTIKK